MALWQAFMVDADRTILYDRIKHLGKTYIAKGYVTVEALEDLKRMHKVYHDPDKLNGNGFLDDLIDNVVETAAGLQHQFVEKWKAAYEDGKLTDEEIKDLGVMLLETTMKKLSKPAKKIMIAAGKDIEAIARDAVDAWLLSLKG